MDVDDLATGAGSMADPSLPYREIASGPFFGVNGPRVHGGPRLGVRGIDRFTPGRRSVRPCQGSAILTLGSEQSATCSIRVSTSAFERI